MSNFERSEWLARQAWGSLFSYPPFATVTIVLVIVVLVTGSFAAFVRREETRTDGSGVMFSVIVCCSPLLVLAAGVLCVNRDTNPVWVEWVGNSAVVIVLLTHLAAFGLIWSSRLRRAVAMAFFWLLSNWFLFWATFVSSMSIAGDWV
jgi:hypothetical protein